MDGRQFDAWARLVGEPTNRRLAVRSLTGGTLGALLALLGVVSGREETEAHDKRKKCRKLKGRKKKACLKKAKKHAAQHDRETPPPGGDQAPPCTADSCPLPPECSQQTLEACTEDLEVQWRQDIEPCRAACQDPQAAACRECLAPIVEGWKAGAETCVAEACNFPASARPATRQSSARRERDASTARASDQVTAEDWWVRQCSTECCYTDLAECTEDARDEWGICMGGAVASCFVSGPACGVAALACMAKLAYDDAKCHARDGCPDGTTCLAGDVCCPDYRDQVCNGRCCATQFCMECVNGTCQDACGTCQWCNRGTCEDCGVGCCGG